MLDPLLSVGTRQTPQAEPIPGSVQVRNNAGGYAYEVDDWARLRRFLVLGVDGGTYYVNERKHTLANVGVVQRLARADGPRLVSELLEISLSGRAPKVNPTLYALAVAASAGATTRDDAETRRLAFDALPRIARTGTHLFAFNAYCETMRGWGRARRRGVARWYSEMPVDKLAYQAIKYAQRDGWGHRDLLRLSHPVPADTQRKALYDHICGRPTDDAPPIVMAARQLQTEAGARLAPMLIREYRLPWEAVPDALRNDPAVWDALLDSMPPGAILRQLPTLTRHRLIDPMRPLDPRLSVLADPEALKRARLHPVALLNALMTYRGGYSLLGTSEWTPDPKVIDLLNEGFYAAFGAVVPADKRTLLAIDVSGSMGINSVPAMPALTARDAAAALAMVTVRTEPKHLTVAFTSTSGGNAWTSISALSVMPMSPSLRLDAAVESMSGYPFGRTDCALPMLWAAKNHVDVDTFHIITDNETWAGDIHPMQALQAYREKTGISARLVVTAMTASEFSIGDPNDAGCLDVVGFDAAAPHVINDFSAGRI